MVWRLDYTTIPPSRPTTTPPSSSSAVPADLTIQLRPFATEPSRPARPLLRFSLEAKDGSRVRILAPDGLKIDWVDDEGRTARSGAGEEVVMTDGCSLMSLAVRRLALSFFLPLAVALSPSRPSSEVLTGCTHARRPCASSRASTRRRAGTASCSLPSLAWRKAGSGSARVRSLPPPFSSFLLLVVPPSSSSFLLVRLILLHRQPPRTHPSLPSSFD